MTALAVINGIAIVVLVIVTAYYAWQTREMAREMRQARLLSLLPKLVLDIEMIGPRYGAIVVSNVGTGPALDADLTIVFEGSDKAGVEGVVEQRRWLPPLIPPGERHEFLLPQGISDMAAFVERHPRVRLRGHATDALGRRHDVEDRMLVAEWWDRLGEAVHRFQEEPATRITRELEKTRKALEKIDGRLSVLAAKWRRRRGPEDEGAD